MKNLLVVIVLITLILIFGGCINENKPVCNKPYILVGRECCLDQDSNKICDKDESLTTRPQTTDEQTHLKECYIFDEDILGDWFGFGGLCNSTNDCRNFTNSIEPSLINYSMKCDITAYAKIKRDGAYLNCDTDQDCYEYTGLEIRTKLDEKSTKFIKSLKQLVRCNKNYCEGTEGLIQRIERNKKF